MANCDDYFEQFGIKFEPEYEAEAVHTVRSDGTLSPDEKKWLILCWFDNTYGRWNGSRFEIKDSRAQMSRYIKATRYNSFEELIENSEITHYGTQKRGNAPILQPGEPRTQQRKNLNLRERTGQQTINSDDSTGLPTDTSPNFRDNSS